MCSPFVVAGHRTLSIFMIVQIRNFPQVNPYSLMVDILLKQCHSLINFSLDAIKSTLPTKAGHASPNAKQIHIKTKYAIYDQIINNKHFPLVLRDRYFW